MRVGPGRRPISSSGAFADRSAPEARALECWGHVGLVERADVAAGRDDLVDAVEDLIAERDLETGQEIVELLHRVWPKERTGHARMSDGKRHREVGHRQACLFGERHELLDDVEPALVTHGLEEGGAAQLVLLPLADAAGEHPLPSGPHTSVPIP